MLDAQKSLWPQMIIATKTKRTLLSRVVVAVVALLCPLFLYQNAAVLYLNVDVAILCTTRFWDEPKNHGVFGATSKIFSTKEGVFCTLHNNLVAPKSIWNFAHQAEQCSGNNEPKCLES